MRYALQFSQMAFLILITFMSVAPAHATDGPLAARDSSAEQAQTTAAQPQQAVTEAQHVAERASSSVAEAKTALAVVDKQSRDTDKRMCALQETPDASAPVGVRFCSRCYLLLERQAAGLALPLHGRVKRRYVGRRSILLSIRGSGISHITATMT